MNLATDIIDVFQGFIFKSTAATANEKAANGLPQTEGKCSSSCCCCCCNNMRDGSTSTHDLFSYVWHTEGEEMKPACGVTLDEGKSRSCTAASSCCGRYNEQCTRKRADSGLNRCQAELQAGRCDASTSTFDLSAYIWGTMEVEGGEVSVDCKGKIVDDEAAPYLGNVNCLKGRGGTKRPPATRSDGGRGGEVSSPPCKKKRKWG